LGAQTCQNWHYLRPTTSPEDFLGVKHAKSDMFSRPTEN
jgi:hypothetical protein